MKTYEISINVLGPGEHEVAYSYPIGSFNISAFRVGPQGPKGDPGDTGIIVSPTPPDNPHIGQLWLDTSTFN